MHRTNVFLEFIEKIYKITSIKLRGECLYDGYGDRWAHFFRVGTF